MIFEAGSFVFKPPTEVAFARRILIKPGAGYPLPHPVTTSRETLDSLIAGIRKNSDADILLLDGSPSRRSMLSIYKALGYNFPRTTLLDVNDTPLLEVENPLPKPYAVTTFWVPSVILSCDFLIVVAPFQIVAGKGAFSIGSLLGLLPVSKYGGGGKGFPESLQPLGIDNVVADLYFTLPFDLGIVDGRKKLSSSGDVTKGGIEEYGKIIVGKPYDADNEASQSAGAETGYLQLIERARAELPT